MTVLDLSTLTLAAGEHKPESGEMCLLEAVAYIAGEPWSDHPECVSPILGAYGRNLNDTLSYETRQRLVPFIPRLLNTAGDGLDGRRSYLALDWLTRTYLPTWLRLVPSLTGQADLLSAASEVTDLATVNEVDLLVREAASQAADAGDSMGASTGDDAWAAAKASAGDATSAAVGDVAGTSAGGVAWAAAGIAAAAAFAGAAAAGTAAVGYAVGVATEAFLAPTVAVLQDSAIDLFDRMLTVTK